MRKALKIFQAIILVMVFLLIALPVSLYIILSTEWAQNDIRRVAVNELSALLGADVSLGRVEIHPFNRLSIYDIKACDDYGVEALSIDEISVAYELFYLLRTGHLVVDFALVDGASVSLYKNTPEAPLNIANILAALKSDAPRQRQSNYDLMVNTVIIRGGTMKYDILSVPERDSIFDPNHIDVSEISLHAYIPRISNDEYRVQINRFGFSEKCGFRLDDLLAEATISHAGSTLEYLKISLPHSSLNFAPVNLQNHGFVGIEDAFRTEGINIDILPGSYIYPSDLSVFAPILANFPDTLDIALDARFSTSVVNVDKLSICSQSNSILTTISAEVTDLDKGVDAGFNLNDLKFSADANGIRELLTILPEKSRRQADKFVSRLGNSKLLSASVNSSGRISASNVSARVALGESYATLAATYSTPDTFRTVTYNSEVSVSVDELAALTSIPELASASARMRITGSHAPYKNHNKLIVDSANVEYRGHSYGPINIIANTDNQRIDVDFSLSDPLFDLVAEAQFDNNHGVKSLTGSVFLTDFAPYDLFLIDKFPSYALSAHAKADLHFSNIDDISGYLSFGDISFADNDKTTDDLFINQIRIDVEPEDAEPFITLRSDYLNADLRGDYRFSTLMPELKSMLATVFPSLPLDEKTVASRHHVTPANANDFTFDVRVEECPDLCRFLRLPISVIYPIEISGYVSSSNGASSLSLEAPYLLQGDKIIENTSFRADLNAPADNARIKASIKMPTKKGPLTANVRMKGASDRITSNIDWLIERKIPINGSFNFKTILSRDFDNQLLTEVDFLPGSITFGSDLWSVNPSVITISDKHFDISNFALTSDNKHITIDGALSPEITDSVAVSLKNVALLDIFETLEIDKALIGGTATGNFTGRALLSSTPEIYCSDLHVDDISYNRCVLGNADIAANWDNEKKSFYLDADITGASGNHSRISGDIFPAGEALDFHFDADRVPVGFLKPFMEAFASDVEGLASGKAHLFGTFKYIDLEGDLFADNLKLKIDFTNTWYSATDSIHLRPGVIDINNVTIRDINGRIAMLNGWVRHKFFKEPSFNFAVSDAHDFLSYNVDSKLSPDWYGTIYGNGGATISGEPGVVNIGVAMTTAPSSAFTFVLSDRLDADVYSFITFTDRKAEARRDSLLRADNVPKVVRMLRERLGADDDNSPSAYNMDLQIDITPDARMTLVMDPVGGDEIKATGAGNLRLSYESLNNDLKMYGTYTLNQGSYNFTLQDIIIKDFTIKEGSSIAFHGDPYSAQLDIQAVYAVNANLSDLDESFLLDKDLNRTNVPVHALLLVKGDMRQPDIDFDLEFPTLTQDTYRKVRSIVSTKDMMNRQIIYLLALNRFYTPDYMASTTKGNELFSVASSTISSQLSSMLGKLSDDWSIAPNLRSDRGDFSDVEVDVALSSRLLNNRLLFNGNFGYRDKTLNTNQFIGDFDVEYLLNPKGSWRLKAYNRYNDQNYYVRTAQTTQGLGIVFKKDFDNFFGFLHKKKSVPVIHSADTITGGDTNIVIPDSIAHSADPLIQQ